MRTDERIKIMLIAADRAEGEALSKALDKQIVSVGSEPVSIVTTHSFIEYAERMTKRHIQAVFADPKADDSFEDLLKRVVHEAPAWTPVMALFDEPDPEAELSATKLGVQECFIKERLLAGEYRNAVRVSIARMKHIKLMRDSFLNMMEEARDPVMVIDLKGFVRFVNPAMSEVMNVEAKDLQGEMAGIPLICGDCLEVDLVKRGGAVETVSMHIERSQWDGDAAAIASIERGVGYYRLLETNRMINEKCRLLASLMNDCVYEIAVDAKGDKKVDWVSKKLVEFTGYSKEELMVHENILAFLSHEEDKKAAEELNEKAWQGYADEKRLRILTKKKTVKSVYAQKTPFMDNVENRVAMVVCSLKEKSGGAG